MKKIMHLSALMVLLTFVPAAAQPGPYVGGGLVYNDPRGSDIKFLDPDFGLYLRFGYDFGPVALEGNFIGSRHDDTDPGFGRADFGGVSIDLRVFLNREEAPARVYLLAGVGSYSVSEFDPFEGADTELSGTGWNAGAGMDYYLDANLALNFGVTYRFIRYDRFDVGGTEFSLRPRENGDMLTIEAGINYHF